MTDNLQKRGLIILDCCVMCRSDGEDIDDLFLHCGVARELWVFIFSLLGVYLGDAKVGARPAHYLVWNVW